MKKNFATLLLALCLSQTLFAARPVRRAAGESEGMNLTQVFAAAVSRSEAIHDQDEQIVQAGERYRQALGSALPTISGTGSYTAQDNPASLGGSNLAPSTQPLVRLTLTQPLFRGLREFKALKQTSLLEKAQTEAKRQAMLQLYYDVSQSFYTVLSLEKDLNNLNTQTELYDKRIKELKDRVRIGRSRLTEVLTIETSASSLRAQMEQVKGQINAAREMMGFLTALPSDTRLSDDKALPAKLDNLEARVASIEQRPDVQGAARRLDAARENTSLQWGAHLPSLDFTGNYYLERFGFQKDVKWDVNLTLSLPIFNGGVIQSRVREAASQEIQSELAVTRVKRQATNEVKTFYENVAADLRQLEELNNTRNISEKNFVEQTKEYRLGLVNNLEVNQALTAYQESQRALDRAKYVAKLDFEKLEAATGKAAALNK